jgi:hypothetical protein
MLDQNTFNLTSNPSWQPETVRSVAGRPRRAMDSERGIKDLPGSKLMPRRGSVVLAPWRLGVELEPGITHEPWR